MEARAVPRNGWTVGKTKTTPRPNLGTRRTLRPQLVEGLLRNLRGPSTARAVLVQQENMTGASKSSQLGQELPFLQDCVYLDYNATTPIFPEVQRFDCIIGTLAMLPMSSLLTSQVCCWWHQFQPFTVSTSLPRLLLPL
jgi:hypothetical protein